MYVLTIPNFSLSDIFDSCQDLNARRVFGFERNGYLFLNGDDLLKVEQCKDRILLSCSDEQFYDKWFDFFDLSTDYSELNMIARRSKSKLSSAARRSQGLHLLRQDPFEVVLKEMLFAGRSPKQARLSIRDICEASTEQKGKTLKGYGYYRWHPMPTPDQLEGSVELLEWVCDTETFNRCVSIIEWSKCHRGLLISPESHSEEEVLTELYKLTKSSHLARRIAVFGWHMHWLDCTSRRQSELIERQTGVDVETMVEFEFGEWKSKAAYVGTVLALEQVRANRSGR